MVQVSSNNSSDDILVLAKTEEKKKILDFLMEKHKQANGVHNFYLNLVNELKTL